MATLSLGDPQCEHLDTTSADRYRPSPISPPSNLHLTAVEVDVSGAEGHDLADPKAMG